MAFLYIWFRGHVCDQGLRNDWLQSVFGYNIAKLIPLELVLGYVMYFLTSFRKNITLTKNFSLGLGNLFETKTGIFVCMPVYGNMAL